MNDEMLTYLASCGTVTFRMPEVDHYQCRWERALDAGFQGKNLVVDGGDNFVHALERVYQHAVRVGFIEPMSSRVITRVMDDGVQTKDGAA